MTNLPVVRSLFSEAFLAWGLDAPPKNDWKYAEYRDYTNTSVDRARSDDRGDYCTHRGSRGRRQLTGRSSTLRLPSLRVVDQLLNVLHISYQGIFGGTSAQCAPKHSTMLGNIIRHIGNPKETLYRARRDVRRNYRTYRGNICRRQPTGRSSILRSPPSCVVACFTFLFSEAV